jgi:P-type Cu2+ transporter
MASAIIHGAGLERYYREREAFAPRPSGAGDGWSTVPTEVDGRGDSRARVQIDGLRCASCVWVIERVLEQTPGVREATVSYATGRASLAWDPAIVTLPSLASRIAALGYVPRPLAADPRYDREVVVRLGVALFATMAIMGIYEGVYASWWYGGMDPAFAALFRWLSLALATPLTIWCASPFFAGAWEALKRGVLHMDLPIALGIAVMYVHGIAATLRHEDAYLDSLAMLVALLLAGRALESRGRRRAVEAAMSLVGSVPRTARRVVGGSIEIVDVDALRPGDLIDVGPGQELPADGTVREGAGLVKMALLTGEAEPVAAEPGDRAVAGTLLVDGALTIEVEAAGSDTVLHRMAEQLQAAADAGMRPAAVDRIAPWFSALTLAVAFATFGFWLWQVGMGEAVRNTVAVLVVACPCALALSRPLAASAGLAAAARRGILFRSADDLLAVADVDIIALDKTGTVTAGEIVVVEADSATLRIAAGLERFSTHPIARAILDEAAARSIPLPRAKWVKETPGVGIDGTIDGIRWSLRSGGAGEVRVLDEEGHIAGSIRLGDSVRVDARETLAALRDEGLSLALLTGDHEEVARRIGSEVGIDDVSSRVDPAGKSRWISDRRREGHRVLFAGDGLNDGPALAAADVGVAMGSGATSSLLVAHGVISVASLRPLLAARRAARACSRAMRLNERRSVIYNFVAIGAAAVGLVNPLVAAVLMPLSSAVVVWGAARVDALVRREER